MRIFNDVILAKSMGLTVEELRSAEKVGLLTTDNFIKMYGVNNELNSDRFKTNEPAAPKAER